MLVKQNKTRFIEFIYELFRTTHARKSLKAFAFFLLLKYKCEPVKN